MFLDVSSAVKLHSLDVSWETVPMFAANPVRSAWWPRAANAVGRTAAGCGL